MRCFECDRTGPASQFRTCSNGTHTICISCQSRHGRYQCPDARRWNTFGPALLLPEDHRGDSVRSPDLPIAS